MMLDFFTKDLVGTYVYTNVASDRTFKKNELVNGHPAIICYQKPMTVMIGLMYKVWDPSVKSLKYVLHVGKGEQDVNQNINVNIDHITEEAAVNARIEPCVEMTFDENPFAYGELSFDDLCKYFLNASDKHVRTLQEVHEAKNQCSYGRRYPYDWLYFDKNIRSEVQNGC